VSRTARAIRAALAVLASVAVAASCKEAAKAGKGDSAASVHRYVVRGEVVGIPAPGARAREIVLRHEAVDDFVDAAGQRVGMDAMVMPFSVGPAEALSEIRVGDKVEAQLLVDWAVPMLQLEHVKRLPADTRLVFGPARRPSPGVSGK